MVIPLVSLVDVGVSNLPTGMVSKYIVGTTPTFEKRMKKETRLEE